MEQDKVNSLFDIRLKQEGASAIRRFKNLAKWVFVLVIAIALISVVETFISWSLINEKYFGRNQLVLIQNKIYPYYTIVYSVLVYLQVHYYFKCSKQLSASADAGDEINFNKAFVSLYKNSLFAVLTLSLSILMDTFQFYIIIHSL